VLLLVLIVEAKFAVTKFLFKILIDRGGEFVSGSLTSEKFAIILMGLASIYVFVLIISAISNWGDHKLLNRIEASMITDVKRHYFNHLVHLDHNFHTTNKTGSLISRLIRGSRSIESMTDTLVFNFSPLIFQILIVGGSLFVISWVPALVVLLTVVLFLTFSLTLQNFSRKANLEAVRQDDREKGHVADILTNIDSIKYFGKEKIIKHNFGKVATKTERRALKHWNYYVWLTSGQGIILGIGTFFSLYFPMVQFLNGNFTLGEITFIYTIYGNLVGPMFSFVHGIRNYYRIMADFEALFKYGKVKNKIKDKKSAKDLKIKKGKIEFNKVYFQYNKRKIFKNFNLEIKENEKVALVGHSGSGKSTLVKILYRLYDLEKGEILIDGKNIKDFKQESLRSELSIVPQECILFDDTVYNNIKFSNPKATRKQVLQAIKFAQLDEVIKEFPKKENTIVGERGVKLSGGEKQRVSIARAILANKKILVLDEATSSLDSETEHEIQRDLMRLMKGRTSIIIAHRLSTIMHADKIVVMEKGKIVQIGKHNTLINQKGQYKKLWNLQKGGYIK